MGFVHSSTKLPMDSKEEKENIGVKLFLMKIAYNDNARSVGIIISNIEQ